jgi:hypothetical protein
MSAFYETIKIPASSIKYPTTKEDCAMKYVNGIFMGVVFLFTATAAIAGDLDSPAAPTSADSAMYTLEDVYNRLNDNTQATKRSGAFDEPDAAPGSTGHTLDQVYEKAIPTQVPKTGQTTSYDTGDDGDLEKGVSWPSPRFTDNSDGTVTDNLTGLIWLKVANYNDTSGTTGTATWADALSFCNALHDGQCDLSDGSSEGDWRLPNVMELVSLIDWRYYSPPLPDAAGTAKWSEGDAFSGVQSGDYWSSTTYASATGSAWRVTLVSGYVRSASKTSTLYVWPVRGGQ